MNKKELQKQFEDLLIKFYNKSLIESKEPNYDIEILNKVYYLSKTHGKLNDSEILKVIERGF